MKVVTRIELAAALLASACDHAYISGQEGAQGDGPNLFALTEELVLRRAREIYVQGTLTRGACSASDHALHAKPRLTIR